MEWCRVIAGTEARSSTVSWLRTSQSDTAKDTAALAKIAIIDPTVGILAQHEGEHDDRQYRTHVGRHPHRVGASSDSFGHAHIPDIRASVKERGAIYGYHALTDERRLPVACIWGRKAIIWSAAGSSVRCI
jgi:hypothetical protein